MIVVGFKTPQVTLPTPEENLAPLRHWIRQNGRLKKRGWTGEAGVRG